MKNIKKSYRYSFFSVQKEYISDFCILKRALTGFPYFKRDNPFQVTEVSILSDFIGSQFEKERLGNGFKVFASKIATSNCPFDAFTLTFSVSLVTLNGLVRNSPVFFAVSETKPSSLS